MRRVILHVGMHKTGSTSIQRSLQGHDGVGFRYLRAFPGGPNHSTFLFSLLGRGDLARDGRAGAPVHVPHAEQLVTAAEASRLLDADLALLGDRRLIVSGEGAMQLSTAELRSLARALGARDAATTVHAYVRPPAAYATSVFQQHIKNGRMTRFDLRTRFCDYRERFEKLDRAFGREQVLLRKFDPRGFEGQCVVRDFCRWIALDGEPEALRSNESLNSEVVRLLYIFHRMVEAGVVERGDTKTHNARVRALAGIDGDRLRFAPSLLRRHLDARQDDTAWMEERLGVSLHESLGDDGPGDIAAEADLWALRPQTVERLRELAGARAPAGVRGDTPEELARLVAALPTDLPGSAARPGLKSLWRRLVR